MRFPRWFCALAVVTSGALAGSGAVPALGPAPVANAATGDHVQAFGGAPHVGSLDSLAGQKIPVPDAAVSALVPTPSGQGYWLALADGNIYSFGDARFHGSLGSLREAGRPVGDAPIVTAVATPSGQGYWLFDTLGGVYSFGDAGFFGSLGTLREAGVPVGAAAIVAAAATPSGRGYWLVDQAGGVYTFGDAGFFGSVPGLRATGVLGSSPAVVAMGAGPGGQGYWLVDDRGGVYTFGSAPFRGSAAGTVTEPVVGFAALADGSGYRLLTADGRVLHYGAPDHGSAQVLATEAALALVSAPSGTGYWVVTPQARAAVGAPPLPAGSGAGRRIVYSNSRQRVWLVEANGVVSDSWPVSGRRDVPAAGTYRVFSKSTSSVDASGSLVLRHMVRFAHGRNLAIGFHAIPTRNGRPIQSEGELGQYRSAGCVRQAASDAARLYGWAPVGTTVVVTP